MPAESEDRTPVSIVTPCSHVTVMASKGRSRRIVLVVVGALKILDVSAWVTSY